MSLWSKPEQPHSVAAPPVRRIPVAEVAVSGAVPGLDAVEYALLRTRLLDVVNKQLAHTDAVEPFELTIRHGQLEQASPAPSPQHANPATAFLARDPLWRFEQLVVPPDVTDALLDCAAYAEVAPTVFGKWNLRVIEPHPSVAVSFRGPPGTGKTMAAHALAAHMGRKILSSRLSDLESKYHGDGPKNLVRLFDAAAQQNAVLFIDEAEALLSRRFAQPEQAAESSINSMRTELLMALDGFEGLVIFATNLPDSYDAAISSRLTHVDFPLPDAVARRQIWQRHLPPELPLAADVDLDQLALIEGVTGRDVRRAVIAAAVATARTGHTQIPHNLLEAHLRRQIAKPTTEQAATITSAPSDGDVDQTVVRDLVRTRMAQRHA